MPGIHSRSLSYWKQVPLDRLKIHSVQIQGDNIVVNVDGYLSMQ